MAAELNLTIVHASSKRESVAFCAEVLGLAESVAFGPFMGIETANEVRLAILETHEEFEPRHYAFSRAATSPLEFRAAEGARPRLLGDSACLQNGETNTHSGGRGVYLQDPGGHLLGIITRPSRR